jgi:DNA-binding GntR family transcriptional regulator
LQEVGLASHYGVSRTPVREALRQLLDESIVERKGRFYQVKELTSRDIRDGRATVRGARRRFGHRPAARDDRRASQGIGCQ